MKRLLLSLIAAFAALPGQAQDMAAERARIGAERTVVEERFAAEERACRAKFAVTRCTEQARDIRNAALADLKRRERVLNEAERKQQAAQRQRELEERTSAQRLQEAEARRAKAMQEQADREARAAEKAARRAADQAERAAKAGKDPKQAREGPSGPQGSPRGPRPPKEPTITAAEAAKNREAFEARRQEAAAHKAEVAARLAKRSKPAASGLPVPP
jgi:hypothetical protein